LPQVDHLLTQRRFIFLTLLLICSLTLAGLGCCANRSKAQPPTPVCLAETTFNHLPQIEFAARQPLRLGDVDEPIWGSPVGDQTPLLQRNLTMEHCRILAAQSATLANQLESHRDRLACRLCAGHPLLVALTNQARHERNEHIAKAQESFLNLSEIYAQQPIVTESRNVLAAAKQSIARFRESQIEIPGDEAEIDRQDLNVEQQEAELIFNQKRLQTALAFLLQLDPNDERPIWTQLDSPSRDTLPDLDEAVATALVNRGDLKALETLASANQETSADLFSSPIGAANPLLLAGPSLPGPAKWWQCTLKDEIECLKQTESVERRRQLAALAVEKRRAIEVEVRDVYYSLVRHHELSELKYQELESLNDSIEAAEKAKDERPVDFASYQERRLRLLKLTSEFLHERFSIEQDYVRLAKAVGGLAE
jgi:hypothetical protein